MKYKLLGNSGLRVSELCLGTMTFGLEWNWGADYENSKKMFDVYREAGGNFIDTANRYTEGTSEKFLGDFIQSEREKIVLATKYSLKTAAGDPNVCGNHRKNLVQALDASLKRLKTDYIDLYWLHAWDFTTPIDEVMRSLDDQVRAGKILYVGVSDTPAWIVSRANTIAELRGWTPFIGLQIEYSLIQRTVERDLIPMADSLGLSILAWSPLGSGLLSGKYFTKENSEPKRLKENSKRFSERNISIANLVVKIAGEIGAAPSQVALKWLMQHHSDTIPIIGGRSSSQIKENINCLNITLTEEQMQQLDEISKIDLGFPHEFLKEDNIKEILFAGTYNQIVKPLNRK